MTDSLQTKIIVGVILILACFGVGFFFTLDQWTSYSLAKSALEQKQAEQQQLKEALSLAENFVAEFNSKAKDAEVANLALPAKDSDLSNLIANLGDMAKASGLALSDFGVEQVVPAGNPVVENGIQTQKINLTASGNYASFKDFVLRLQNNIRIMDVDQVTAKADESGQVEYQMVIRAYYQK